MKMICLHDWIEGYMIGSTRDYIAHRLRRRVFRCLACGKRKVISPTGEVPISYAPLKTREEILRRMT